VYLCLTIAIQLLVLRTVRYGTVGYPSDSLASCLDKSWTPINWRWISLQWQYLLHRITMSDRQ